MWKERRKSLRILVIKMLTMTIKYDVIFTTSTAKTKKKEANKRRRRKKIVQQQYRRNEMHGRVFLFG